MGSYLSFHLRPYPWLTMGARDEPCEGDGMREAGVPTTNMFRLYCVRLAARTAILIACIYLFVTNRPMLDPSRTFGPAYGLNLVDVAFVVMLSDLMTKFFERALISMGSLKQYRRYQIPTSATAGERVRDTVRQLVGSQLMVYVREKADMLLEAVSQPARTTDVIRLEVLRAVDELRETGEVSLAYARRLLNNRRFLDFMRFNDEYLEVNASERSRLRTRRLAEIAPVIVFWVAFNAAIALVLALTGNLTHETAFLWSMFYFAFDVFSVVVWCPIQIWFMRNRCCATCQIFNWDGAMAATPLLFVGGWFGWIIIAIALVVLVRWEIAAAQHPERFSESTNARLSCAQCSERLCRIRGKVAAR